MKKNARENRMETMKANGMNTNNFFDLSMRIPVGEEVKLIVGGKEVSFDGNGNCDKYDEDFNAAIAMAGRNGVHGLVNVVNTYANTKVKDALKHDPVVQKIKEDGYIYNPKTDGRFVAAQTFKMLNGESVYYKRINRIKENGWNAYLRNCFSYMYQFEMMADEFHRLAKMEIARDRDLYVLRHFFNKEVAVATCEHYLFELKKWVKQQKPKKHQGRPYVNLDNYRYGYCGMVHLDELEEKVYGEIEKGIYKLTKAKSYYELEKEMRKFMKIMVKLPYNTPKCSDWKDAFKANGAFKTLNNIVKHHGCLVQNYETGKLLNRDESLKYIESLIYTYKGEYWKYHELLKATIELNNFNLRESIKEGNRGIVCERD